MSNELSLAERMRLANIQREKEEKEADLRATVPEMARYYVRYMEKRLIEREGEKKSAFAYREYGDYALKYVECIEGLCQISGKKAVADVRDTKSDNNSVGEISENKVDVSARVNELEKGFEAKLEKIIKRQSERKWQMLVESVEESFIKLTYDLCGVVVEPTKKERHYLPKAYQREGDAPRSFWDFIRQNMYKVYQILTVLGFFLVGQIFINILYELTPIYQNWSLLYLMPLASVLAGIKIEYDILKEETGVREGWILAFVFGGIYALLPLLAPIFIWGYIFYDMAKKRSLPKSQVVFMTIYGFVTSVMLECGLIFIQTQKIMFPINLGWENIPVWITGICFVLSCITVYLEGWIVVSYFESERLKGGLGWIFGVLMCIAEITCPLVGGYLFMLVERLVDVTFNLRAKKPEKEEIEE